ncbi:MAG: hypothetical protein M9933_11785 [Chitinophagaceae bacterium]|nr:hypothetical protein [Chitinophagaceae bacterium]
MEEAATEKHEYYRGEIFAMPGAKMPQIRISRNLLVGLTGRSMKISPLQIFTPE